MLPRASLDFGLHVFYRHVGFFTSVWLVLSPFISFVLFLHSLQFLLSRLCLFRDCFIRDLIIVFFGTFLFSTAFSIASSAFSNDFSLSPSLSLPTIGVTFVLLFRILLLCFVTLDLAILFLTAVFIILFVIIKHNLFAGFYKITI